MYTTTPTSDKSFFPPACTGSTTVWSTATSTSTASLTSTITLTSTVWSTVTGTATITYTETASVTATETASVTATETDSVTATETDSVTVTESTTTTITATSTQTNACATATPVTSWTYLGCYTDSMSSRTLSAVQMGAVNNNSAANCQTTCLNAGYAYAGVEDKVQCFCDSSIRSGVILGGTCNSPCSGVGTCGGLDAIDIYRAVTAPCANGRTVTPWTFLGCYPDSISSRTLSAVQMGAVTDNSVESCQTTCLNAGYAYAGVEDQVQCFCDSSIRSGVTPESLTNCQSGAAAALAPAEVPTLLPSTRPRVLRLPDH
ncbi:hypothetical protein C8F04DRAFT_1024437 [Mycena alexandri]|uniref:WSC domain-containing protein n=1 Tax=Mycena alexandri TaxID=1745969 RepID=A0AAD6TIP8_9AGAR|nr:hypothetical protein C8F04DRAFT_1024437 [Mycena alexandri]